MFLSYTASIVLLSLALYGLWYVIKDIWNWIHTLEFVRPPDVSFVILVRNMEHEIEDLIRYLVKEIVDGGHECDAVIVDCGSDDLTPIILKRLATEMDTITFVTGTSVARPVAEVMPLCRGAVVHILDLTSRLNVEQFMVVVSSLLRQNKHEVAVKSRADA